MNGLSKIAKILLVVSVLCLIMGVVVELVRPKTPGNLVMLYWLAQLTLIASPLLAYIAIVVNRKSR